MKKPHDQLFRLRSPEAKGPAVKKLQRFLINGGYLPHGSDDGEYGIITAQAVYRAKYWLGYARPDRVAGTQLMMYLNGAAKPTASMKALAAKRKARAKRKAKPAVKKGLTLQQHKVQAALSQLGQTEHPPNSNVSKFSLWYGMVGAWCAMFQTWISVTLKVELKTWVRGRYYAYVPYIVVDAIAGRRGLMVAPGPADGVRVCFDWQGDKIADHIGMAAEESTLNLLVPKVLEKAKKDYGPLGPGDFWCVEGNTGIGNDSNGGEVMLRKRNRANVRLFVKVAA
jgi:hypothetical protein